MGFEISVDNTAWDKKIPGYERIIENSLKAIKKFEDLEGEISILLTDDENIQQLNKNYRGKDKPTNVLSFPQEEPGMLGDIALALETLEREAEEQEKSLSDHFTHLFVHGVLHLRGYDHELGQKEQDEMEALEIKILKDLGVDNPYL